ncbi:MAG: DUF1697 domain-containing protein [Bacteroidota bacterium]
MNTYIVFLRGINVSGQKTLKMVALKQALEEEGFVKVQTYIQSGNLVLRSSGTSKQVSKQISALIFDKFAYKVPALVTTAAAIKAILSINPFKTVGEPKKLFFTLLFLTPAQTAAETFNALQFKTESFYLTENCVYLYCKVGAGKAKLNNNLIEQKLCVTATTRNLRTLEKMIALADAL